ncbi:ABC transporter [Clostridia bacterium]|nr:ABC transporter [Clostridia bacterium]
MLKLSAVTKNYVMGATTVEALRGIDIEFRKSEFVAVLGPSGCGKTTLLNIIGGLDRYTSGDLTINGVSTKEYKDGDWDIYRNKAVGFVFQTYNLITHQSVLSNVELALTLSGVSKGERRRRAADALKQVGLGDQLKKKPNQLSGGQMQRVAIARALVNNPEILLADEPTGALDTETSVQIMEILKEVSKDRLVIMVTHNPELADHYSNRVVKLVDGRVVGDSNPYSFATESAADQSKLKAKRNRKSPLSIATALSLSLNNLLTKKGRTILTGFAGSIGIIGIALILSLSNGMQEYINDIERGSMSSYPLTIQSANLDMLAMLGSMRSVGRRGEPHELDKVYSRDIVASTISNVGQRMDANDLKAFKAYLDTDKVIAENVTEIQYQYDTPLTIYKADTSGGAVKLHPSDMSNMMADSGGQVSAFGSMMTDESSAWKRLIGDDALLKTEYEVIAGRIPTAWDEVAVITDERNEITDYTMYSMGLKDPSELTQMLVGAALGLTPSAKRASFTYDEILNLTYKLLAAPDVYERGESGWVNRSSDNNFMKAVVDGAPTLKVVGILRTINTSAMQQASGGVGYTAALTEHLLGLVNGSEIVKEQRADPAVDVFTQKPFKVTQSGSNSSSGLSAIAGVIERSLSGLTGDQSTSSSTYEDNMSKLGAADIDSPSSIRIYPKGFEAKEKITDAIAAYNKQMSDEGQDERVINYTDITGLLMSSVNGVIGGVSTVLIAFVAISLVVSSIMIGIITYISVLERTKEIGVLRSLGASKGDISRVFNAETLIVGFVAGALGIAVASLLIIPANAIILSLSNIRNAARLPLYGAVGLVLISMALTFIAGLIPSRMAAKKDPVVALRTE